MLIERRTNSQSPSRAEQKAVKDEEDPETMKKLMNPVAEARRNNRKQLASWTFRLVPLVVLAYGLVFAVAVVFQERHAKESMPGSPESRFLRAFTQELQAVTLQEEAVEKSVVLPNVLMVGAQQAGVAELSEWLFENGFCHPEVHGDEPLRFNRGVPFFDKIENYQQGLDFYADRYEHCKNKKFIMDASPNTLPHPDHVEKVYKEAGGDHLDNLKVVAILREPVARELSLYNHKLFSFEKTKLHNQWFSDVAKKDGTTNEFYQHVDTIINDFVNGQKEWGAARQSFYAEHLKNWFSFVKRENFLIINYDEYQKTPRHVDQRIRDFLGLDFSGHSKGVHHDEVGSPSCGAEERLNEYFIPANQELYTLLEENPGPAAEQSPFPHFQKLECDCNKDKNAPEEPSDAVVSLNEKEVDSLTTEEQRRKLKDYSDFSYYGENNNSGNTNSYYNNRGGKGGDSDSGSTTTTSGSTYTTSGSTSTTSGSTSTASDCGSFTAGAGDGGAEGGGSPAVESGEATGDLTAPTTRTGCI